MWGLCVCWSRGSPGSEAGGGGFSASSDYFWNIGKGVWRVGLENCLVGLDSSWVVSWRGQLLLLSANFLPILNQSSALGIFLNNMITYEVLNFLLAFRNLFKLQLLLLVYDISNYKLQIWKFTWGWKTLSYMLIFCYITFKIFSVNMSIMIYIYI